MSSNDSEPNSGPMLGALLRIAHAAMVDEYTRWLADSQYRDIQPAHAAAIQPLWERPEGIRLTTLAQTAGITKQSMGALVDSLEQGGYVERIEDPDDGRASRIRLTARGRTFARHARSFAKEFESRLAESIGVRKVKELRSTLELVVASLRD
jgi:DNA-binding MarR family transcriptional regulator